MRDLFNKKNTGDKNTEADDSRQECRLVDNAEDTTASATNLEETPLSEPPLSEFLPPLPEPAGNVKDATGSVINPEMADSQPEAPLPEPLASSPKPIPHPSLPKFADALENMARQVAGMESALREFSYRERINKELHEELQRYKSGLRKEMMAPLLKHIILLHGRLMEMHDHYANNTLRDIDAFQQILSEYKKLPLALTDLLHDYEIETLAPQAGEPYQPKTHEALRTLSTDDPAKNRTVASCEKAGFIDVSCQRVLKRAEVTIFKLNPVSAGDQANSTNEPKLP